MDVGGAADLVWTGAGLILVALILVTRRARKHGGALQAGFVGATYEMHNRDKQRALDLVVQKKAAARRPEYPDGNLPELAGKPAPRPQRRKSRRPRPPGEPRDPG